MADTRQKNQSWVTADANTGKCLGWDAAQLAVLMDIRDELKTLNSVFQCANFLRIPWTLDQIRKQTTKKKKKRVRQTVKA